MLRLIFKAFYCLLILIVFNAYNLYSKTHNNIIKHNQDQTVNKEQWINILIHGSVGLRDSFNFSTLSALLTDKVEGSFYQRNVLSIRKSSNILAIQPIDKLGLHEVCLKSYSTGGAYLYAVLYNLVSSKYFPEQENKFYTYGWSGLVSFKQRLKEASCFYKELRKLIFNLNSNYKIRIIGYSHGATLAFNLAHSRNKFYPHDQFKIEEMVTIGMPVLTLTETLAKHTMFKKIYHISSKADWIQYLDLFSPCNFTSHRNFHNHNCKKLRNKLTQINISVYSSFNRVFPDSSPSHTELWFFGWAPGSYNKKSILYPLPTSIFIPYFVFLSKNFQCKSSNYVKLRLYPNHNLSSIRSKSCYDYTNFEFIPLHELNFTKEYAFKFAPRYCYNRRCPCSKICY